MQQLVHSNAHGKVVSWTLTENKAARVAASDDPEIVLLERPKCIELELQSRNEKLLSFRSRRSVYGHATQVAMRKSSVLASRSCLSSVEPFIGTLKAAVGGLQVLAASRTIHVAIIVTKNRCRQHAI